MPIMGTICQVRVAALADWRHLCILDPELGAPENFFAPKRRFKCAKLRKRRELQGFRQKIVMPNKYMEIIFSYSLIIGSLFFMYLKSVL